MEIKFGNNKCLKVDQDRFTHFKSFGRGIIRTRNCQNKGTHLVFIGNGKKYCKQLSLK